MAQVTFNDLQNTFNNQNNTGKSRIGYFSLKNDNDEALVRVMHDSVSDFDIVTGHTVPQGNAYPFINCIRNANDPVDMCPLCSSGAKLEKKIYIHLIEYVTKDGKTYANAKVFGRTLKYANKLKSLIDTYGPLSDIVCKVVRHGKAGAKDTEYEFLPLPVNEKYSEENYPKHPEYFEGYKAVGTAVQDKTYEELVAMVEGKEPSTVAAPKEQQPVQPQKWSYAETQPAVQRFQQWTQPEQPQPEQPQQQEQRRVFNPQPQQPNFNFTRPKRI